jgi:hypothetical protein
MTNEEALQKLKERYEPPQDGCVYYVLFIIVVWVVSAAITWAIDRLLPSRYDTEILAVTFTIVFAGFANLSETRAKKRKRRWESKNWIKYEYLTLLKKAESGDRDTQFQLGREIHLHDCEKECGPAKFWVSRSAEQGHFNAQEFLVSVYGEDARVVINLEKAAYWYRKAADRGDCQAQLELGNCYAEGKGVPEDHYEAMWWYLAAAEHPGESRCHGDAWFKDVRWTNNCYAVESWRKLGALYLSGLGVTKDEAEAYAYYSLVGLNCEADRKAIAELEAKLKPAELEAGKRRAKELREKLNAKRQQAGQGK